MVSHKLLNLGRRRRGSIHRVYSTFSRLLCAFITLNARRARGTPPARGVDAATRPRATARRGVHGGLRHARGRGAIARVSCHVREQRAQLAPRRRTVRLYSQRYRIHKSETSLLCRLTCRKPARGAGEGIQDSKTRFRGALAVLRPEVRPEVSPEGPCLGASLGAAFLLRLTACGGASIGASRSAVGSQPSGARASSSASSASQLRSCA